jgi:hypothetical protein
VTIHEIIDVIAVRHRFVSAIGAMRVIFGMTGTGVRGRAVCGVCRCHGQGVFFDFSVHRVVVQMTIVEIIHVVFVLHAGVAALGAVLVIMVRVRVSH